MQTILITHPNYCYTMPQNYAFLPIPTNISQHFSANLPRFRQILTIFAAPHTKKRAFCVRFAQILDKFGGTSAKKQAFCVRFAQILRKFGGTSAKKQAFCVRFAQIFITFAA
ncbi:MAG: hypothetical protein IJ160_04180 [Muribaculaceae bacterium]|nr:hypothetical protein [Muribaculaceae bacterium]